MIDLAFVSFTAVMSITPGPNNLMLAASGVNHGFRRTVPHMFGITAGVSVMFLAMAFLLGTALSWFSLARTFLAIAGCCYLLWLSWKIIRAGSPADKGKSQPLGFWGAFTFQALNPKVWITAINATLLFIPAAGAHPAGIAFLAGLFAVINLSCIAVWAFTGDRLRRLLAQPRALFIFNLVMGGLMAITAIWLLVDEVMTLAQPGA
jgi:threonine/homoserine/homoserine lactone efflux protein